jgi:diguanylate cyclase (GGDEF)-like protein
MALLSPSFDAAREEPAARRVDAHPHAFRGLLQATSVVAALTHVAFCMLFLWSGVGVLAAVNVGSVLFYTWTFFLARRGHVGTVWWLTVFEVIGHALLATVLIGWGSGFHHYMLLLIPVTVVGTIPQLWLKVAAVAAEVVAYVVLDLLLRQGTPPHPVPPAVLSSLYYFNMLGAMLFLAFLAGYYHHLIERAQAALRAMADTDPLTRLRNRRSVMKAIAHEESRMDRGHPHLSFVMCDIDHFKSINDTRGHDAGDQVLKAVSQVLASGVRDVDFLARWGGEEFLAVLPDTDGSAAALIAERLRVGVEALRIPLGADALALTLTLGVATVREGESAEHAIGRADAALYAGKRGGRNRVVSA